MAFSLVHANHTGALVNPSNLNTLYRPIPGHHSTIGVQPAS